MTALSALRFAVLLFLKAIASRVLLRRAALGFLTLCSIGSLSAQVPSIGYFWASRLPRHRDVCQRQALHDGLLQSPGASWKFTGVTLDPFNHPDDPRVNSQFESAWVRRIAGQKFLFLGNMYAGGLCLLRFLPNSEIAVPTGYLSLVSLNQLPIDISPNHPTWTVNETSKRIRWWWLDNGANNFGTGAGVAGDAHFDTGELGLWNSYTGTSEGIDFDDAGGIWFGGGTVGGGNGGSSGGGGAPSDWFVSALSTLLACRLGKRIKEARSRVHSVHSTSS